MKEFMVKDCALLLRMSGLAPAVNLRELRERLRAAGESVLYHHFFETPLRTSSDDPFYRNDFAVRMLEAIDEQCERHNLPRQIAWEAHIRCGMGLCGSCELPAPASGSGGDRHAEGQGSGWLVCLDGPVSFSG